MLTVTFVVPEVVPEFDADPPPPQPDINAVKKLARTIAIALPVLFIFIVFLPSCMY